MSCCPAEGEQAGERSGGWGTAVLEKSTVLPLKIQPLSFVLDLFIYLFFNNGKRGVILICIVNGSGESWDYSFYVCLKGLAMGCIWGKSA